jgi:hypothetical protein
MIGTEWHIARESLVNTAKLPDALFKTKFAKNYSNFQNVKKMEKSEDFCYCFVA